MVSTDRFVADWSGSALFVGRSTSILPCAWPTFGMVLAWFGVTAVVAATVRHLAGSRRWGMLAAVGVPTLIGSTLGIVQLRGTQAARDATAVVVDRHLHTLLPAATLAEVRVASGDPSRGVLVDARAARDYERGSIPGAVSLPVGSTRQDLVKAVAGLDRDRRLIVFCQSARCGYAGRVAARLRRAGFSQIVLFREGYEAWAK